MGEFVDVLLFFCVIAELLWVAIYIDVQISRCVNKDERLYAKKRMENARVNSANRFLNIVGVLLYAPYVWPIKSLMIFIVVAVTTVVLWSGGRAQ